MDPEDFVENDDFQEEDRQLEFNTPDVSFYVPETDVVYGCLEIHLDFIKVVCFYLMYLYNGL